MKMILVKKVLLVGGVLILMFASFYIGSVTRELNMYRSGFGTQQAGVPPKNQQLGSADDIDPVNDSDHILGERNAKIALIEYSDFQCPYCKSFHATAKQAVSEYSGDVAWIYRHFPLDSIHPDARNAAVASECVAALGGNSEFWTYADLLFASPNLSEETLLSIAAGLNLDIGACITDEQMGDLVDADFASGTNAGVTGTPGNILLNTETGETVFIPGALPYDQVSQAIDQLL